MQRKELFTTPSWFDTVSDSIDTQWLIDLAP